MRVKEEVSFTMMQTVFRGCGVFLVGLLFLVGNCQCEKPKSFFFAKAPKDSFTLLYTTNVQGYVEPCGCTSEPLGGIARLAFLVEQAERNRSGQVAFLDAGNLFFDSDSNRLPIDLCQDEARLDLLLSVYKKFDIIGTLPGTYDLSRGKDFYANFLRKHEIVNLAENKLSVEIITKGKINLAVFGVAVPEGSELVVAREQIIKEALRVKSTTNVQIVVAVVQSSLLSINALFNNLSEVDVVIWGNDINEKPRSPSSIGVNGPLLVAAGKQGQYLGVLEFTNIFSQKNGRFILNDVKEKLEKRYSLLTSRRAALMQQLNDEKNSNANFLQLQLAKIQDQIKALDLEIAKPKPVEGAQIIVQNIALQRDIAVSPTVEKQLRAYEQKIPELVLACETNVECEKPLAGVATFVGVKTCKQCHEAAVNVWEEALVNVHSKDSAGNLINRVSGHAVAWSTLEKVHKDKDRSCIGCHSVGFMQPGGYCKVSEMENLANVQCESCHGPGSLHAVNGDSTLIKRHVPENVCRSCHHVPHIESSESFVYKEKLKLILGEGHGFDLLKQLEH